MKRNLHREAIRESTVINTCGEILHDGTVLEPVASPDGRRLELLIKTGNKVRCANEVQYQGRTYQPQPLHPSFLRVMRFPRKPTRYGRIRRLFSELKEVFKKLAALPDAESSLVAFWAIGTWFADCVFAPPLLCFSGADLFRAMAVFSLLHAVCRHALICSHLSPRLASLTAPASPTLLVNAAGQPRNCLQSYLDSIFPGTVVAVGRSGVTELAGAKALFVGTQDLPELYRSHALRVALSPLDGSPTHITDQLRNDLADRFGPRLLKYRLDHLQQVRESRFDALDLRSPDRPIARSLGCCIQGDDALVLELVNLLRARDDVAWHAPTVEVALTEILWPSLHLASGPAPRAPIKLSELTCDVNAFLHAGGELLTYMPVEIGKKVAELNLSCRRKSSGNFLELDRETSRRIHRLARQCGAGTRVAGCSDCEQCLIRDAAPSQAEPAAAPVQEV